MYECMYSGGLSHLHWPHDTFQFKVQYNFPLNFFRQFPKINEEIFSKIKNHFEKFNFQFSRFFYELKTELFCWTFRISNSS